MTEIGGQGRKSERREENSKKYIYNLSSIKNKEIEVAKSEMEFLLQLIFPDLYKNIIFVYAFFVSKFKFTFLE